jgi:hypothetical protein
LPDGTYITTEWVVVCFVPIVPIKSVRILDAGPAYNYYGVYRTQNFKTQRVPLDKDMVLKMYGWLVVFAALFACIPWFNRLVQLLT